MTQADSRHRRMAEWHLSMAGTYRADAELMLERSSAHSAGALLYESAKQCLNAVANQQGENPGYTRAKTLFLESLGEQPVGGRFDLERGWSAASRLHIHADRGHLDRNDFRDAWVTAQDFIDDMLDIYAENSGATL